MDRILLTGVSVRAHVGVPDSERKVGQTLKVDVELFMDLFPAARSDNPSLTADYGEAEKIVRQVAAGRQYKLIEAVAEAVALALLKRFKAARSVRVRVNKRPKGMPRTSVVAAEIVRRR